MANFTIGGSESAAAIGLDPYRSRIALWAEKTGVAEPREAGEPALWGQLIEPIIREQVKAHGYIVLDPPGEIVGPEPWQVCHPDGFAAFEADRVKGVLEVKTAGPWVRGWENDGWPVAYGIQCHRYMAATSTAWALLACLVGGQRLELRRVEFDPSLWMLIVEAEREFIGYCEAGTPPPPDGSDASGEIIARMHPTAHAGEIVELTADDMRLVGELRAIKEARKETERQEQERVQALQLRLGDAELGVYEGSTVVRWQTIVQERKAQEARRVEYRRFSLA